MNKTITIQRQLIAGFLAAVFLFITAFQALHQHNHVNSGQSDLHGSQVNNVNDCPVCDYHFIKDGELITETVFTLKIEYNSLNTSFYQNRKPLSIGLSYADRGPPALI